MIRLVLEPGPHQDRARRWPLATSQSRLQETPPRTGRATPRPHAPWAEVWLPVSTRLLEGPGARR
eukprot:5942765-Pyramimonas_sp.AAC.1